MACLMLLDVCTAASGNIMSASLHDHSLFLGGTGHGVPSSICEVAETTTEIHRHVQYQPFWWHWWPHHIHRGKRNNKWIVIPNRMDINKHWNQQPANDAPMGHQLCFSRSSPWCSILSFVISLYVFCYDSDMLLDLSSNRYIHHWFLEARVARNIRIGERGTW